MLTHPNTFENFEKVRKFSSEGRAAPIFCWGVRGAAAPRPRPRPRDYYLGGTIILERLLGRPNELNVHVTAVRATPSLFITTSRGNRILAVQGALYYTVCN